jgi:multiple sugar transport system substrate-binding protein
MREAALALTRRDGEQPRFGFGFEPNWWQLWVRQAGCAAGSADGNALLSQLDEPGCIVGMQFLQDLVHTDRVTPPLADLNSEAMGALFRNGQLAMMFGNHALIPSFAEAANLSWDVAPLPRGETRVNVGGGAGFVISQRSQHKEAAWQLVKFLTGPKAQAILAESGAVTPARRSVREDNIFLRQQPYQAEVFVREGEYARMAVEPPGGSEAERLINSAVEQVMSGRRPAAEVMAETGPRVRAALAANAP